jgi:N6-adenosine-specific RNA methylase IME4
MLRDLPRDTFSVILADPPFSYDRNVGSGIAANHYRTLSDDLLKTLPVKYIATRNAILFLWCSGPTLDRAIALLEHWGFRHKTIGFVWVKTNKRGTPQPMGLGSYTLPGCEIVLLATKGKAAPLVQKRVKQIVMARRGAHSAKPINFRRIIHEMTGNDTRIKKIELFSRHAADREWSVWGDQIYAN